MKKYYGTQYKMNYNQSKPKIYPNLDLSMFRSTKSIVQKPRPLNIWDEYTNPMTRIESAHIIKFVVNRVLKALPTDNARLFFLQSELLAPEFKEYQQGKWYMPMDGGYEYDYYCEVQRQLKSLKEKTHGIK